MHQLNSQREARGSAMIPHVPSRVSAFAWEQFPVQIA